MTARKDILEQAAIDLLSVPPLVFRQIRRKLIRSTLAGLDAGITLHHVEIIRLLEKEGDLHVAEIGDKLQIARAQMTALVEKLVTLNLVERRTDAADRRITILTLSDYGRAVWREHRAGLIKAMREAMEHLSDEELQDLSQTLRRLQEMLSKLT